MSKYVWVMFSDGLCVLYSVWPGRCLETPDQICQPRLSMAPMFHLVGDLVDLLIQWFLKVLDLDLTMIYSVKKLGWRWRRSTGDITPSALMDLSASWTDGESFHSVDTLLLDSASSIKLHIKEERSKSQGSCSAPNEHETLGTDGEGSSHSAGECPGRCGWV